MFLEASVDTGSCEKCFICIVIITRTSAPGCIYILMFYSSSLSNAPLNYTERRQCQTPIAPNLLLHCVKQQPSNPVYLITTYSTTLITALTLWNTYHALSVEHIPKPQIFWSRFSLIFLPLDASGMSTILIQFLSIGKKNNM